MTGKPDSERLDLPALQIAAEHGAASIAFPAISTGAFGYPMRSASAIAVRECAGFLEQHPAFRVVLIAFREEDAEVLRRVSAHPRP